MKLSKTQKLIISSSIEFTLALLVWLSLGYLLTKI